MLQLALPEVVLSLLWNLAGHQKVTYAGDEGIFIH